MLLKILIFTLNVILLNALPSEYKSDFDERQIGTVNVRLNIKDFAIIFGGTDEDLTDLSDDTLYEDYDYSVDQLTINPASGLFTDGISITHKPSTSKPFTTNRPNSIQDIINSSSKPMQPNHHEDDKPLITPPATIPTSPTTTTIKPPNIVIVDENDDDLETPLSEPSGQDNLTELSNPLANMAVNQYLHAQNNQQQIPVQILIEPQSLPPLNKQHPKSHYILNRFAQKPSVEILGENVKVDESEEPVLKDKCDNDEVLDDESGLCKKRHLLGIGGHGGLGGHGGPLKGIRKILNNLLNKHHFI